MSDKCQVNVDKIIYLCRAGDLCTYSFENAFRRPSPDNFHNNVNLMSNPNPLLMNVQLRNLLTVSLLLMAAASCLQGCVAHEREITEASEALENRNYKKALKTLMSVSDVDIIKSDTLSQLLSTAYYGFVLRPVGSIAYECYDMDFTPDGKSVIFTDFTKECLNIYSFPDMKQTGTIELPAKAYQIDITPDGKSLAAAMADNSVLIYDVATGSLKNTLVGHSGRVRDVVFRDDKTLFSCSNDRQVVAWDVKTGAPIWHDRLNSKNIKRIRLSHDGKRLITSSNDGSACVLSADDADMGHEQLRLVHGQNYVNDAVLSADNKIAVTASGDGYVKIWDAGSGTEINDVFFGEPLGSVDISPDGRRVAIGGVKNVYLLDPETGKVESKINSMNMEIWGVKFLADDRLAFIDSNRFWTCDLYTREKLVKEARRQVAKNKVAN